MIERKSEISDNGQTNKDVARFHRGRNALFVVLEGLSNEDFAQEVSKEATLRMIIGKVITVDEKFISDAGKIVEGFQVETELFESDVFDFEEGDEYGEMDVNLLLRRLRESSRKIRAFLKDVDNNELTKTNGQMLGGDKLTPRLLMDYSNHDWEYVYKISEWRERTKR